MKNFKMFSVVAVFVLAIGTALGNQEANEPVELKEDLSVAAYIRTIPNDPDSCVPFTDVNCTTMQTSILCTWADTGEQLFDSQCAPLYKPI